MSIDFKNPRPGVYANVPFSDYVQIEAINWHKIAPGRKSALQMRHEMLLPSDANKGQVMGGALDCMIFDGLERFGECYATMPRFDGHPNSNAYKAQRDAWQQANAAAVHLTADEMGIVQGMYKALRAHPIAWALLSGGKGRSQLTIIWRDEATGELCKGRIDRLAEVDSAILTNGQSTGKTVCLIDLKSTREPGIEKNQFPGEVVKYGYHGQLGMYRRGCIALKPAEIVPIIVAVQNDAPFDVIVHRMDAECSDGKTTIDHGEALFRRLLDTYHFCKSDNKWPGQFSGINPLQLPVYAQEPEAVND